MNIRLDNIEFPTINREDNDMLANKITKEEIKTVVWDCESNKSPGPDGFNFNFIKKFWGLIKEDTVRAVTCFHSDGSWLKGTNASFISLIPKVDNPQSIDEYRPISLVGSVYKIISKFLAKRLQKILHKVINIKQSAFIENRGSLDKVVVANEVVDEVRRKKGELYHSKGRF